MGRNGFAAGADDRRAAWAGRRYHGPVRPPTMGSFMRSGRVRAGTVVALTAVLAAACTHPGSRSAGTAAAGSTGVSATSTTVGPQPTPSRPRPAAKPTSAPAGAAGALAGKVIVIDPGHNGGNAGDTGFINKLVWAGTAYKACDTTGTQTDAGYPEHAFTFDTSLRLKRLLEAAGAKVILTHGTDTGVGPCVNERAAIGNVNRAAVVISFHADGGPSGGYGFHVMEPMQVGSIPPAVVTASRRFAVDVRDAYQAVEPVSTYIGSDGLNPRSDMAGLNLTQVPKVMLEAGNMRNAGDAGRLGDPAFRQRIAAAMLTAISRFLA